jgi:hypothetical protein
MPQEPSPCREPVRIEDPGHRTDGQERLQGVFINDSLFTYESFVPIGFGFSELFHVCFNVNIYAIQVMKDIIV